MVGATVVTMVGASVVAMAAVAMAGARHYTPAALRGNPPEPQAFPQTNNSIRFILRDGACKLHSYLDENTPACQRAPKVPSAGHTCLVGTDVTASTY